MVLKGKYNSMGCCLFFSSYVRKMIRWERRRQLLWYYCVSRNDRSVPSHRRKAHCQWRLVGHADVLVTSWKGDVVEQLCVKWTSVDYQIKKSLLHWIGSTFSVQETEKGIRGFWPQAFKILHVRLSIERNRLEGVISGHFSGFVMLGTNI